MFLRKRHVLDALQRAEILSVLAADSEVADEDWIAQFAYPP